MPQLRRLLLYGYRLDHAVTAGGPGLMLPGTALLPATSSDLREFAREAGRQSVWLSEHNLCPATS